jgi:arylsulfatase A-like enzyme/beta-glucanase (GH16 family)
MAELTLINGSSSKKVKWNRLYPGIILLYAMLAASCQGTGRSVPDQEQPNIIVILTDDQGYTDVGFNGCKDIPTPNIDRIASNGVVFTNGYVTFPVCGPSRAGLITGRYHDRFGFSRNPLLAPNDPGQGLPLTEETMATVLGRSGYRSSALGKWHLGAHRSQWPLNRGFDEFYGFLAGGHQYFPELWTYDDLSEIEGQWDGYRTKLMRNDGRVEESEYLTDALSREAVDFIDRHAEEQPFFLYLAYNAPHTPLQATDEYLDRFAHIQDEKRRTYAAMVSAVDDGVGLLLDKIESLGIEQQTIIFFLSDNGGPEAVNGSDNGPLRDGKGSLYEGGIHVPFAMQWPGKIPAGTVYEEPVLSLDIMATAVAGAGAEINNPLDGVDLVPYLTGEKQGAPHDCLFWRKFDQQWHTVSDGGFKLHEREGEGQELYELQRDLSEAHPLSGHENSSYPALKEAYIKWEEQMKDPVFLGLMQDREYSKAHPGRFKIPDPFQADNTAPLVPRGYRLAWSDEFDYQGSPDQSSWSFENGFVRNEELQWYQKENAKVKEGLLVIEGRREQVKNPAFERNSDGWKTNREYAYYTSSSIKTRDKFDFQYGIMEVRARIDTSMGSWPAIWTLGVDRRWPENGEVDVMEYYRVEGIPTILANAARKGDQQWNPVWDSEKIPFSSFLDRDPRWPEKFHIWKMVWTEDVIRLYLDEELLNEIDLGSATCDDGFNPFRQPHYILLNLALGANGGNPSGTSFPLRYEVDYVRVYQPD